MNTESNKSEISSDKNTTTTPTTTTTTNVKIGDTQTIRPNGTTYIIEDCYTDDEGVFHKGDTIWQEIETVITDEDTKVEKKIIYYETTSEPTDFRRFEDRPDGRIIIIEN